MRDSVVAAVDDCPIVVPATKDGTDGGPDLVEGVVGKVLSGSLLDLGLEFGNELLQLFGREFRVVLDTGGLLFFLE